MTKRTRNIFLIALAGTLLVCCLMVVAGFFIYQRVIGRPPGQGIKAESGYQTCQPIIDALARFYTVKQAYPETLDELSPDYLDPIPKDYAGYPIEYKKTTEAYQLTFSYEGPGMNHCSYIPARDSTAVWNCYGYY